MTSLSFNHCIYSCINRISQHVEHPENRVESSRINLERLESHLEHIQSRMETLGRRLGFIAVGVEHYKECAECHRRCLELGFCNCNLNKEFLISNGVYCVHACKPTTFVGPSISDL